MANGITQAALWAAVFTPTADEIAREIVQQEWEMRQEEEKAYWIGWDREFKRGTIQDLREHKYWLITLDRKPIYPQFTQDDIADMIESGELYLVTLNNVRATVALWADENREEAKDPKYLAMLEKVKKDMEAGDYRIVK